MNLVSVVPPRRALAFALGADWATEKRRLDYEDTMAKRDEGGSL